MEIKEFPVAPERLLLDPNNYRFMDITGFKLVSPRKRFGDAAVQSLTMQILRGNTEFDLQSLRESILSNGFVKLELLVVEEFDRDETGVRYLVIEGNRRVAAVKSLLEEHRNGQREMPQEVLSTIEDLPVFELSGSESEREAYKQTLMAIRHIAGIREWGPYQQAMLITQVYEIEDHQWSKVGKRIGIRPSEVARRFRAIKALQQMEEDDEFGDQASPRMYALFHEAMAVPNIRQWLGWNDETFQAEDYQNRRAFYELILPRYDSEGQKLPPKIDDVRQVRSLKNVVDNRAALKVLLDPEASLSEALDVAKEQSEASGELLEQAINRAHRILKDVRTEAWELPSPNAQKRWNDFTKYVGFIEKIMQLSISS